MHQRTQEHFDIFQQRISDELLNHPIIQDNKYCKWASESELTKDDVSFFIKQFSVFSNLFLVAQLYKVINAVDLNEMHAAKEILVNELGGIFNRKKKESVASLEKRHKNPEEQGDPSLVNTQGTVDGGTFRFKAAHFEWLLDFVEPLGLTFSDIGKRKHGIPSTLFFCDELIRIYGSESFVEAAGASYAVENWAAAGFWKQLIQGLKHFKETQLPSLHLAFFTWHDKVEDQHKQHTRDELRELYFSQESFDESQFIRSGNEMLDGVAVFWNGLNKAKNKRYRI